MLRDIRKSKLFNRRTLFIGASQGVLGSALIARLSYLQLIKHQEYSIQSDSNRIKQIISPAPRGAIVDRFGFNMVNNESSYRLFLYLSNRKINLKSVDKLVEILNLNQKQKRPQRETSRCGLFIFQNLKNQLQGRTLISEGWAGLMVIGCITRPGLSIAWLPSTTAEQPDTPENA